MNPQKIAIMTDSCTDVPQELVEQYQMYVVPMRVIYHDREYTDKVDITPQQVYDRLEEVVPHTSLPSIDTVCDALSRIEQAGYEHVIAVSISGALSGTGNAMRLAAEQFPNLDCRVIDTLNIGIGAGFQAIYAGRLIEQGLDMEEICRKIALFCNMEPDCVIPNTTASTLYEVPLLLEREGLANVVCRKLELACGAPDLTAWSEMVARIKTASRHVSIALVGKYTELHDAYLSVEESLFHAGTANNVIVDINWVDSSKLTQENAESVLGGCAGILVPGGFGDRGIEGMIVAAQYARTHKIPYFGICLGMQIAVIEFARHVLGWEDAHSAEFDEFTKHPVIDIMPEQKTITQKGGTMRLGAYPCVLSEGSRAAALYGKTEISERHRHRYEFCNDFRDAFVAAGLVPTGLSPDGRLVEVVERHDHPFYIGVQYHPEFKSRPNRPHPLFRGFIAAALEKAETR